ncbi:MAG: Tic20 family protein [Prochlorococcaceae cyanobacterium]
MGSMPIWQRLLAALAYLLPWSDAVPFGQGLYQLAPSLQWLALPALPLAMLQRSVPFGGFLLFLVLFLVVVRNPKVPYSIRFNVLQAILLDIVLVLLSLGFNILLNPIGGFAQRTLNNTVFLGALLLIGFAVVQCLRGKDPDIPSVSEAVRMQIF